MFDIESVSPTDAWAVGYAGNSTTQSQLIDHWNGSSWTATQPNPEAYVHAVSAISANDVWAVGEYNNGVETVGVTFAEHWNGTQWTQTPTQDQQFAGNVLRAVDGSSATNAWAVGTYNGGGGPPGALIERWNGSAWSRFALPSIDSSQGEVLNAVSVPAANVAWAAGSVAIDGFVYGLVLRWNGSSWSVNQIYATPSRLFSISALSATDVWAVGDGIIEHWDGSGWTNIPAPVSGASDVQALSPTDVWIAGAVSDPNRGVRTFVARWNGSSWTVIPSANYADAESEINQISMASDTSGFALDEPRTMLYRYGTATLKSMLVLHAPTNPVAASPVAVTGTLTFPDGNAVENETIHVTRTDPNGATVTLPTATTDWRGDFTIRDQPTSSGPYTYAARYDGATERSGSSDSVTFTVAKATTTVALTTSRDTIGYGGSVKLTAHLAAPISGLVTIFKTPYGGTRQPIATSQTNADGDLIVTTKPTKRTTYTASFAGDDAYEPAASAPVLVRVHVAVGARMVGGYATRHGYRLYHYTTACASRHSGCPVFAAQVLPNHAAKAVRIVLQRGTRTGWRTLFRFSVKLNSRSQMTVAYLYDTTRIRGIRYRTNATFPGDADHMRWTSKWKRFKIT